MFQHCLILKVHVQVLYHAELQHAQEALNQANSFSGQLGLTGPIMLQQRRNGPIASLLTSSKPVSSSRQHNILMVLTQPNNRLTVLTQGVLGRAAQHRDAANVSCRDLLAS